MKTKLFILATLLFSSSAAFSAFEPVRDNKAELQQWHATYTGETNIDNLDVLAVLEVSQEALNLNMHSILPMDPIYKKIYRMSLIPVNQPDIRVKISLVPTTIASISGRTLNAFVNADKNQSIQLMIVDNGNGLLRVQYQRKVNADNLEAGVFELSPAVASF